MEDKEEVEDTFLECEICKVAFTGVEPYTQHMQGSKHKKKEANLKMKEKRRDENPPGDKDDPATLDASTLQVSDSEEEEITCPLCNKKFSGLVPYQQHLKNHPHRKAEKRQRVVEKLRENISDETKVVEITDDNEKVGILPTPFAICKVCEKTFSGPESFEQHLKSKQHQRKLVEQKILDVLKKHNKIDSGEAASVSEPDGKENQYQHNLASSKSRDEQILQELEKSIFESENLDNKEISELHFSCEECEKKFSGPIPYAQHLMSDIHKKKLKQLKDFETAKEIENEEKEESSDDDQENAVLTCDICHTAFSGPENMLAHMKSKKHSSKVKLQKLRKEIKAQKNILVSKYSRKSNEARGDDGSHSKQEAKSEARLSDSKVPIDIKSAESSSKKTCVPVENLPAEEDEEQPKGDLVDASISESSNVETFPSESKSIQTDPKKSVLKKIAKAVKVGIDEL